MMNRFGVGDTVTLIRVVKEPPRHLAIYGAYTVTGAYLRMGKTDTASPPVHAVADSDSDSIRYMLRGFPDDVGEHELSGSDAELMDRVRCFAEAGRANGNGGDDQ